MDLLALIFSILWTKPVLIKLHCDAKSWLVLWEGVWRRIARYKSCYSVLLYIFSVLCLSWPGPISFHSVFFKIYLPYCKSFFPFVFLISPLSLTHSLSFSCCFTPLPLQFCAFYFLGTLKMPCFMLHSVQFSIFFSLPCSIKTYFLSSAYRKKTL